MGTLTSVLSKLKSKETQKHVILHKKEIKIVTVMRKKFKLPKTKTNINFYFTS